MDDHREQVSLSLAQHAVRLQTLLDRRIMSVLNEHGLSRSELDVLGALAECDDVGARPGELSSRLLLTTGGLSNILRRLHDDGVIERETDPSDARSHIVRLTPKGKATAHETGIAATVAIGRALDTVEESLLQETAELLHRVLIVMDEDAPVHRDPPRTS
ncbi:MarR family winged helix-turn-helix transcriptional regulator [Tsukamurella soli]|uniref:MarR family transcriptional regulator n=1 Tax=Tsukamurella soli TaxID=644556 RepID=A0ABP8J7A1_9ACTN